MEFNSYEKNITKLIMENLAFCHNSKLDVCLLYRLMPKYLQQRFADLMLQTATW